MYSTPSYLVKRNGSPCPHRGLYRNLHSSFICNSPNLETTQCPSLSECTTNVMGPCNGISSSHEQEWIVGTQDHMGGFHNNHAKWEKPDQKKEHVLCDSTCVKLYKMPKNLSWKKADQQRHGERGGLLGHRECGGCLYDLAWVPGFTCIYVCQTHEIEHVDQDSLLYSHWRNSITLK